MLVPSSRGEPGPSASWLCCRGGKCAGCTRVMTLSRSVLPEFSEPFLFDMRLPDCNERAEWMEWMEWCLRLSALSAPPPLLFLRLIRVGRSRDGEIRSRRLGEEGKKKSSVS